MASQLSAGPFTFVSEGEQGGEGASRGHQWPKQDLIKYAAFLNFSKADISTQEEALSWSFLRKMSLFIQTKNPNQCRIFHKKMMETHLTLDFLIAHLRGKIDRFEQWYEVYEPSLKNVKHCLHREALEAKQPTSLKVQPNNKSIKLQEEMGVVEDKAKEDLKPTDVDYPEENIQPSKFQSFQPQVRLSRPSFGFQSFRDDSSKTFSRYNNSEVFSRRTTGFLDGERTQEWAEGHNFFLSYLGKLGKLVEPQE